MFPPGQRLDIISGAFAGMSGMVFTPDATVTPEPEGDRDEVVYLMVQLFGAEVPVVVRPEQVRPA